MYMIGFLIALLSGSPFLRVQIYKNICLVEQKAKTFNRNHVKLAIINGY